MTESDRRPIAGNYVGLISGTSMDGVDAVAVSLDERRITTLATITAPYPERISDRLRALIKPDHLCTLHEIACLDIEVAQHFASTTLNLLEQHELAPTSIVAVGSHGQTIRHDPVPPTPYSWQIGSAATIAALTGITTVADFRSLDVALGGEGAPLVPPFHRWCFGRPDREQVVVNIGGIANISVLKPHSATAASGYDTGPGNCLMDEWCYRHCGKKYDHNGAWAATGTVNARLLTAFLKEPYFAAVPPKSTGREFFNSEFIERMLAPSGLDALPARDVQATLAALTAQTILNAIDASDCAPTAAVYVCGGGAHNKELMRLLRSGRPHGRVETTAALGVEPDFVEAAAFAWLAQQRLSGIPVHLTTQTPPRALLLGAVHAHPPPA